MDRMKAMDKVKKLLALANDKGATESEAATALQKAKELADNYGIRIYQTSARNTSPANNTRPAPKAQPVMNTIVVGKSEFLGYNPDFVDAILSAMGYRCQATNNYFVVGSHGKFNVEAFHNAYKKNKVRVVFRDLLKKAKEHSYIWGRDDTTSAKAAYCSGIIAAIIGAPISSASSFYMAGYNVGKVFRGVKFDV